MTVPVKPSNVQKANTTDVSIRTLADCDLQLVFTNLSARSWHSMRLILQHRADVFMYNPDKTSAFAGFIITPDNMRKVLDVYLRVYNWKSVFIKIKGSNIETTTEGTKWIHCWIMAHVYANPDDHCHNKNFDPQLYTGITGWYDYINEPHTWIEDRLDLPCKNISWKPDTRHPGTYKKQYMEACQCSGCNKCPFFNINKFRQYVVNTNPDQLIESKKEE